MTRSRARTLAIARSGDAGCAPSARRGLLAIAALLARRRRAARGRRAATDAGEVIVSHGISTFGDLKYPADFEHFDYVNPDAPKGGTMSFRGTGGSQTFDSLNPFILEGRAGPGPRPALRQPARRLAPTSPTPPTAWSPRASSTRRTAAG